MVFLSNSVGHTNLWLDRVDDNGAITSAGGNLRIDVLGTNQPVTIANWLAGAGNAQPLAEIEMSSSALFIDSGLNSVLAAMNSYEASHGSASFNPATAPGTVTDPTMLAAVNAAWHS